VTTIDQDDDARNLREPRVPIYGSYALLPSFTRGEWQAIRRGLALLDDQPRNHRHGDATERAAVKVDQILRRNPVPQINADLTDNELTMIRRLAEAARVQTWDGRWYPADTRTVERLLRKAFEAQRARHTEGGQ